MTQALKVLAGIFTTGLALAPAAALADRDSEFEAKLEGVQEVPSVISGASGKFKADLDERRGMIRWQLSYEGLEGAVLQAHIHVGQRHTNGGITVFLCANGNVPAAPPPGFNTPCPPPPAHISGTITAANVRPVLTQGVSEGEFAAIVKAIKKGAAYVNVHSSPNHLAGEIRGQIRDDD